MRSKIVSAVVPIWIMTLWWIPIGFAQLPTVPNSKLSVDCVRTREDSFYGFLLPSDNSSIQLIVERNWLEQTFPDRFSTYRKAEDSEVEAIVQQYESRIDRWIAERANEEELVRVLKLERTRIRDSNSPEKIGSKKFMVLRFAPKEVKHVFRQAAERKQHAALAWHQGLDDVTITPDRQLIAELADRKGSLAEARLGLAQQLPASKLTEPQWDGRKAMFEYTVLRQMEFQGHGSMLLDASSIQSGLDLGQLLSSLTADHGNGLSIDLGSLGKELGLPEFQNVKPAIKQDWTLDLTAQADRKGYRSVLIKRSLPISKPDWVEVEITFMAKIGNRWQTLKKIHETAQLSSQKQEDMDRIAQDPQIKSVLQTMQGLGLNSDDRLLQQALLQGTAVEKATQLANQQMGEFLQMNTLQLDMPFVP